MLRKDKKRLIVCLVALHSSGCLILGSNSHPSFFPRTVLKHYSPLSRRFNSHQKNPNIFLTDSSFISEHIVASDQRVLPKVVRFPVAPMNASTMLTGKPTQICLSWLFFNKSPAVLKPRKSDYDFKSQVRGKYFVHVHSVSWGSPP